MLQKLLANSKNIGRELEELFSLSDVLRIDLELLLKIEKNLPSQTWRRVIVRSSWGSN